LQCLCLGPGPAAQSALAMAPAHKTAKAETRAFFSFLCERRCQTWIQPELHLARREVRNGDAMRTPGGESSPSEKRPSCSRNALASRNRPGRRSQAMNGSSSDGNAIGRRDQMGSLGFDTACSCGPFPVEEDEHCRECSSARNRSGKTLHHRCVSWQSLLRLRRSRSSNFRGSVSERTHHVP